MFPHHPRPWLLAPLLAAIAAAPHQQGAPAPARPAEVAVRSGLEHASLLPLIPAQVFTGQIVYVSAGAGALLAIAARGAF